MILQEGTVDLLRQRFNVTLRYSHTGEVCFPARYYRRHAAHLLVCLRQLQAEQRVLRQGIGQRGVRLVRAHAHLLLQRRWQGQHGVRLQHHEFTNGLGKLPV